MVAVLADRRSLISRSTAEYIPVFLLGVGRSVLPLDMNALGREESKSGNKSGTYPPSSFSRAGETCVGWPNGALLVEARMQKRPQGEYAMRCRQRSPRQRDSRIGSRLR